MKLPAPPAAGVVIARTSGKSNRSTIRAHGEVFRPTLSPPQERHWEPDPHPALRATFFPREKEKLIAHRLVLGKQKAARITPRGSA
jgi:hypothetical protein